MAAELSLELETAKTIARMAASVCQAIQAEMVTGVDKAGQGPVTIADYASQAVIGSALAENFPDDGMIAEERSEDFLSLLTEEQRLLVQHFVEDAIGAVGSYGFDEQVCAWLDFGRESRAARRWVIDPIDGTKGFLARRHYCVAIALMIDFEPVLGVLASPGFYDADIPPEGPGVLTYALRGQGAFCEPLFSGLPAGDPSSEAERQPVRVSDVRDPRLARLLSSFESAHSDRRLLAAIDARLGRGPDSPAIYLDSQDKHAMIAAGMGDCILRVSPDPAYTEKIWDHAAGYAIVTEAGGRVTDLRGAPLDWSAGAYLRTNRGLLVTNGHLHQAFVEAAADAGLK